MCVYSICACLRLCVCVWLCACMCVCFALPLLLGAHLVSIKAGSIKRRKKTAGLTVFHTHSLLQTHTPAAMNTVLWVFLLCMQGYLLTHALDCADGGTDCDSGQVERAKVRAFYTLRLHTHLHLNCGCYKYS